MAATARIVHYWPEDAGQTVLEIEVDADYPDALDEARAQVVRLWRETCAEVGE